MFLASRVVCSLIRLAVPPMWKVRMVSWVPGSPMDCAAMTPTASPISTTFAGGQIAPVAAHANAAPRLAGEHGADFHPLDAGRLDGSSQVFVNLLVDIHDDVAFVILNLLEHDAAHDAVAEGFDHFAGFHDGLDGDAVEGAAVEFRNDRRPAPRPPGDG